MALVRYIGPHTEPVVVGVIGQREEFEVNPGEPTELPDWLVHGIAPTLEPGAEGEDDEITDHGVAGLLEQPDNWELVGATQTVAETEGEQQS